MMVELRNSKHVLLLSAVLVVWLATLVSASETCNTLNLRNASHRISAAVDTLTGQLSCTRGEDSDLQELEQNLRQIVVSTLNVFFHLGTNESGFDVLDVFGVLDSLNQGDHSDSRFIRLWFSVKMVPLFDYLDESFLIELSRQSFICSSYQELIEAMSEKLETSQSLGGKLIYTHFIQTYLSRPDLPEPGCTQNVDGSAEWLKKNLGSFSVFASLEDIQNLNNDFSAEESLSVLTPTQLAQLILSSGDLNDTDIIDSVFERLEEDDALDNVDEFLTQLTANGKVPDFQPVVRDHIMNLTFTIISPHFQNFQEDDWFYWFHLMLVPVLPSFRPSMLMDVTTNINCTNYHVVVSGIAKASPAMPFHRQQRIAEVLVIYLRNFLSVINEPDCRQGIQDDGEWLEANFGPFSKYITYSDLKVFNLSVVDVVDSLSPSQKAELILDPDSGALEDEIFVSNVVTSLTASPDDEQFNQFFQTFANINKQRNTLLIRNPGVRDTILNLTLTALAPKFYYFEPEDFELWFQDILFPVMASLQPGSLVVIPSDINCASYAAILTGLRLSLESLPLYLSYGVRSSKKSLKETFKRCSVPASFRCKETLVDEDLICAGVNRSQLKLSLSVITPTEVLCDFTITEHACSSAAHLTANNLVTLMNCSLEGQRTYPVEVWKLFFQKASPALDQAFDTFSTLAPNSSNPSLSTALEALGEVIIANFSLAQLQNDAFVSSWFQTKIRPFLASPSPNFLFCLSSQDFSCQTYQTVIQAFSSQKAFMDRERQQTVFTHFIKPFLSRNDTSDPGCVSFIRGSIEWLQANLGSFSGFATLQDLQALNANFSADESLSVLTPTQLAQLILSSGDLNDTVLINGVFEYLEEDDALENVDEFLTQLTANGKVPDFQPVVRDHIMNWTFTIISPHFQNFQEDDWFDWFHLMLVPVLPSFRPSMLMDATTNINCVNYHVVVSGIAKASTAMPFHRRLGIAEVLLSYLRNSLSFINEPVCRQGIQDDGEWLEANFGPFSKYITYSDLKVFNLSVDESLSVLTPTQSAQLILNSGDLNETDILDRVFERLEDDDALKNVDEFLTQLTANGNIPDFQPIVRDHIMNLTFTIISPHFQNFQEDDWFYWFHLMLVPVLPSFRPSMLMDATTNINCTNYHVVVSGIAKASPEMPFHRRQRIAEVLLSYLRKSLSVINEPDCRQGIQDDGEWLEANFGPFSKYITYSDLKVFNLSVDESLSVLTPTQLAQLILSSGNLNDTGIIDSVFERLEEDDALDNVDEFLTQLTANGKVPDFQPVVRDHIMNWTFTIISPHFQNFQEDDWFYWFHLMLVPVLPSFRPSMLMDVTTNINCTNYHVVVSGIAKTFPAMPFHRRRRIAEVLLGYLRNSLSFINEPDCRQGIQSDGEWLEANFGPFSKHITYSDLKVFNLSVVDVVDSLSPSQKAELILDPDSGALEDEIFVSNVVASLTASPDDEQFNQFFQTFANINKQRNTLLIRNPGVRDTILNLTLTALAPKFDYFEPEDFELWFQDILFPVMASLQPGSLVVIPSDISCASYAAILTGLRLSLESLPLYLSYSVRSSKKSLQESFKRCSVPASFRCKETLVDEDLICAAVNRSQLKLSLSVITPTEVLCDFTITEHACSSATHLTANNLVTLMNCSLEGQRTYPVEVWKLFFQKASPALDQAFDTFSTLAPNSSNPSLSTALEALGEAIIANFSLAQLQNDAFVSSWFQTKIRPFLASPSPNFLFCLSSQDFSCQTYQTVIQAFSSQKAFMDRERQQTVFTHFIKPFLSRNDSSDPGCVSFIRGSIEWLQANLGSFSGFATLQDLQALNANFSAEESLSVLTPTQLAQLILSSGDLNDTVLINGVFEYLEEDDALENVDEFLTQLTANGKVPDFQPVVRDHIMNWTFTIISPHFQNFQEDNWFYWFHLMLVPVLPSFRPSMLMDVTTNINCVNYHVVVSGIAKASPAMSFHRRQRIAEVLLSYLRKSLSVINEPDCRQGIQDDGEWLEANFGPFSKYITYSDLKVFNLSVDESLSVLTPTQLAQLILSSGNLNDTDIIDSVFERLEEDDALDNVDEFLTQLTANGKVPDFQPVVRDHIMNWTFTIISPHFQHFQEDDWFYWFHLMLVPVLPSFRPSMLMDATTNINCTNYHVVVSGIAKTFPAMPFHRRRRIAEVLLGYLRNSLSFINKPDCRQGIQSDGEWLEANFGPFSKYITYSDLKVFNLSVVDVVDSLSPSQKAELILDPDSGALEDEVFVSNVVASLTASPDDEQFNQFFRTFANINKQRNTLLIRNPGVRDTILNLTLTALAPKFDYFEPEDFELWFQDILFPVMASLQPGSLVVIPSDISCASYAAILTGLRLSLESLPLHLSYGVRSSKKSLQETFKRCSVPASFRCKETLVDEDLICAAVNRSQLKLSLSVITPPEVLCDFTITEHACSLISSKATHLTANNLVTLMNCSLEGQRTYPVEVWKLFFQKASPALDQAFDTFSTLAPNSSNPSLSTALEALGEAIIANFSLAQLQNDAFISSWFQTKIRPFLASPSPNFLFCLSSQDFSCQTYQTVIQAFSSQKAFMDRERQQTVFTHFIKPFLSRNDSSDPGCVSFVRGSIEWLQANLGSFSGFATLQDLQTLNANFSAEESLSVLTPTQLAQLILSSGDLNDTVLINGVFEYLEEDDALENVDEFLTQLTANGKVSDFQPVVRDHIMNWTFTIISPHFQHFQEDDWFYWFHLMLVPVLPSFRPSMLMDVTTNINCVNHQVVVSGIAKASPEMPFHRRQRIAEVLLSYLRKSLSVINEPDCRQGIQDDGEWLEANFGPFSKYITYSDLKVFNLSVDESLSVLTPTQLAQLILSSGNLNDTGIIDSVFERLEEDDALDNVDEFLTQLTANGKVPDFQPVVRDHIMNWTFTIISPHFQNFQEDDWFYWFHLMLVPVLPSFRPSMLMDATTNINCTNYHVVVSGIAKAFPAMPFHRRRRIAEVLLGYLRNSLSFINEPDCRQGIQSDGEWLEANFGPFSKHITYSDLKVFNLSVVDVVDSLSPRQKAELILDPDSGALEDEVFVSNVVASLTASPDDEQFNQFFQTFANINKQRNTLLIRNPGVRDTILNLTLTALAPKFDYFEPEDFELWFQDILFPVMASLQPGSLVVIPSDISCASYAAILTGLRLSLESLPLYLSYGVRSSKKSLKETFKRCSVPASFRCKESLVDEDLICAAVNRSQLKLFLSVITPPEVLCDFTITEHACSSATHLTANNLVTLMNCSLEGQRTYPVEVWKLFFQKASPALDQALYTFSTLAPNNSNPSLSTALEALGEVIIANFSLAQLQNDVFVSSWFQTKIHPFLVSPSPNFLFCLSSHDFSCQTYQTVIQAFSSQKAFMDRERQQTVFTHFIKPFLSRNDTSDPGCVSFIRGSIEWLQANLGSFSGFATLQDLQALNANFSGVEAADLLTLRQLAQLTATPSQLQTMQDVTKVMTVVDPVDFGAFFDIVSPAIELHPADYTVEMRSAFLQEVLDRGGLSSPAINDTEFLLWLSVRLSPLLVDLSPSLVMPLFDIGKNRSCSSTQEMIALLDTLHLTLSNNTQQEIFKSILLFLQGPMALKCYSGGSVYIYLRNTFLSFGFPDLSMFISLLPLTQKSELLNTISTSELHHFLSQPNVIGDNSDICFIFDNYNNTPAFLETEDVPDDVKMVILPCVWPLALSSNSRSEIDSWFDLRLTNYLRFLSKSLISSTVVQNASCLAFQKLISVMGNNFTYSSSDFGQGDVYTTISTYLSTGSGARCYNASDAELNSTAWFVNYIGNFVTFITVDDLTTFLSSNQADVFLVDRANLELFNNKAISGSVTDYYISQLFDFNPTFNLLNVPGLFLCSSEVPILAFSSVNEADTMHILDELKKFCNGEEDLEIFTALASNIQNFTAGTFVTLGSASSGLTRGQISSVSPSVLVSSLSTLSSVGSWNQEQATVIIRAMTTGGFLINSGSSLESLGTLIAGVPSESIEKIPASELFRISQSSLFVSNMLAAPTVLQQIFVQKIISVDSSAVSVVQNIPDALATEIPPSLLLFSAGTADISQINRKMWTADQAAMFFGTLAGTDFDIEQLSPSVLQGFTCTSVHTMTGSRIQELIHASRPRRGRAKVQLKESQLTCMYNLLNGNIFQNFQEYPSDMLLYFNNADVESANCASYFSAVGAADFSVASKVLNKDSLLLSEAKTCLGISGIKLSRDNVEVLGNMACTLDSSYIQNADPLILEKLKACKDLSDSQVAAMEMLLLSGKTQYGNATTWNLQTLENLEILSLYLTRQVWSQFKSSTKRRFLKSFMPHLRKRKTKKGKLKALFQQLNSLRSKRAAGCTLGNITQVTVSDSSFPFGYDQTQFDLCLDIPVLVDNLNSICEKVDDDEFQRIILEKLNQAYPSSVSDDTVQVLGSVSRVASLNDISKWNITKVDTLAALMNPDDGPWEAAKIQAIITQYLSIPGNSLGSTELNSIDSNLCSLNTSTLRTISPDSIRNAKTLDVTSCSLEQKKVLYEISNISFSSQLSSPSAFYNLIQPYLGGAPLTDVVALSTQNVNMGVDVFQSLDPEVIAGLTVTDVKGLIGSNLQDLKLFENAAVVQTWRNLQTQADLNTLGVGLTTDRADLTTTPPSSTNTATSSAASTVTTTQVSTVTTPATPGETPGTTPATTGTTPAGTTSGGAPEHPASILVVSLLTAVLQMLQQPA